MSLGLGAMSLGLGDISFGLGDISFGDISLGPLANEPWFGWPQAVAKQSNCLDYSDRLDQVQQNVNPAPENKANVDDKANVDLLDARLKAIEAHLNIHAPKTIKFEPNEIIEILDDTLDDDRSNDFNPKMTSTRMKEEKDETTHDE